MPRPIEALWVKFTDGELTPEESQRLAAELTGDPALKSWALDDLEIAGMLDQLPVQDAEFARRFEERLRTEFDGTDLLQRLAGKLSKSPGWRERRTARRERRRTTPQTARRVKIRKTKVMRARHDLVPDTSRALDTGRPRASARRVWAAAAFLAIATGAILYGWHRLMPRGPAAGEAAPGPARATAAHTAPVYAKLAAVRTVAVRRRTSSFRAGADTNLKPGDEVHTDAGARASLQYPGEETRIDIGEEAVLQIREESGKRIELYAGRIEAAVASQPTGRPMAFSTPQADVIVLGTRFVLSVLPPLEGGGRAETTVLEVREGAVQFTGRSDNRSFVVLPRHMARAEEDGPTVVESLDPPVSDVLFFDDFNAAPLDQWPLGWGKHPAEPMQRSGWVVSRDPKEPGERIIDCALASRGDTAQHAYIPFSPWPAEFEISFRLRPAGSLVRVAGIELEDTAPRVSFAYDAEKRRLSFNRFDQTWQTVQFQTLLLQPGEWSVWRVTVAGRHCALSIDGKARMAGDVPALGTVRAASLVSRGPDSAQYDNVKVARTHGAPKEPRL
ncbi:MAG: FecR domain-containing protein [Kiritimatiellae bacterium]|nr:FecR domain-containing protein [Kiritimatiellia bacterium]